MKIILKEVACLSEKNWHRRQIYIGECACLQLRNYDVHIKQPDVITIDDDGTVIVTYDKDSNVRVDIDENNYAWCYPAIKPEVLNSVIKNNLSRL